MGAVLNRHHYSSTVERAALASAATGFAMLGAVLLNDSVGGLNPDAADLALRLGGRWIGLPTMGARHYRQMLARYPADLQRMYGGFGRGALTVLDERGELLPEMRAIFELVAAHEAVLNLGYIGFDESLAVVAAAAGHRVRKLVMTNILETMRYSPAEADRLLAFPGTYLELTAHTMHPTMAVHGPSDIPGGAAAVERTLGLIRRHGVERCVLSSDGGLTGAPGPAEMLAWGVGALAGGGLDERSLRKLVYDNPSRLLERGGR